MMDMHTKIAVLGYWHVKEIHFLILILNMEHSKCCSHLSSSSFMLKGQLPKPVLCSITSGPKFSLKVQTPLFISTPPNSQRPSCGCQDSRAGCHAPPMVQSPAPTPREAGSSPQATNSLQFCFVVLAFPWALKAPSPKILLSPPGEAFPVGSAEKSGIW